MNAEQWSKSLDANAFTTQDQWLSPDMAKEIAALLRAGIAASEECERLRRELAEAQEALRNLQMASDPLEARTDNRETLRNALAEIERLRDLLEYADDDNDIAEEFIADLASEADTAWLAAWDAEWHRQFETADAASLANDYVDACVANAKLRTLLERTKPYINLLNHGAHALLAEIEGAK